MNLLRTLSNVPRRRQAGSDIGMQYFLDHSHVQVFAMIWTEDSTTSSVRSMTASSCSQDKNLGPTMARVLRVEH